MVTKLHSTEERGVWQTLNRKCTLQIWGHGAGRNWGRGFRHQHFYWKKHNITSNSGSSTGQPSLENRILIACIECNQSLPTLKLMEKDGNQNELFRDLKYVRYNMVISATNINIYPYFIAFLIFKPQSLCPDIYWFLCIDSWPLTLAC